MRSIAFAYGGAALFSIPLFDLPRALRRSRGRTALGAGTIRCVPLLLATDVACRSTSSLPMPSCFQLPSQLYVLGPCFFLRRTSIGSSLLRGAHLLRESLPTCLRSGAKARRSRRSYGAGASGVCVCARVRCVCVRARVCVCDSLDSGSRTRCAKICQRCRNKALRNRQQRTRLTTSAKPRIDRRGWTIIPIERSPILASRGMVGETSNFYFYPLRAV